MGVSSDEILSHWSKNFHLSPDANCRFDLSSWFQRVIARHFNVSVRYFSQMSYTTDVFYLSVNLPFYCFHQKYVKYVRNLLSITACGEHCVLATRADDSSGQVQYTLYGANFSRLVKVMQNSLVLLSLRRFLIGIKNSQLSFSNSKRSTRHHNKLVNQSIGTFSKQRWRRQRGRGKIKDLMSRTIAQHVRFNSVYISQPSSAK